MREERERGKVSSSSSSNFPRCTENRKTEEENIGAPDRKKKKRIRKGFACVSVFLFLPKKWQAVEREKVYTFGCNLTLLTCSGQNLEWLDHRGRRNRPEIVPLRLSPSCRVIDGREEHLNGFRSHF